MNLHPRTLTGTHIRLEPVTPAHREEMRAALDCDQANWDIQVVSARGEHFAAYCDAMLHAPGRVAFAVRDIGSGSPGEGRLAGTSSFLFVNPQHATCEIGRSCQGSGDRRFLEGSVGRRGSDRSIVGVQRNPTKVVLSWGPL